MLWYKTLISECGKVRLEGHEFNASLATKRLYLKQQKALLLVEWEERGCAQCAFKLGCVSWVAMYSAGMHTPSHVGWVPVECRPVFLQFAFPRNCQIPIWNVHENHLFYFCGEKALGSSNNRNILIPGRFTVHQKIQIHILQVTCDVFMQTVKELHLLSISLLQSKTSWSFDYFNELFSWLLATFLFSTVEQMY